MTSQGKQGPLEKWTEHFAAFTLREDPKSTLFYLDINCWIKHVLGILESCPWVASSVAFFSDKLHGMIIKLRVQHKGIDKPVKVVLIKFYKDWLSWWYVEIVNLEYSVHFFRVPWYRKGLKNGLFAMVTSVSPFRWCHVGMAVHYSKEIRKSDFSTWHIFLNLEKVQFVAHLIRKKRNI